MLGRLKRLLRRRSYTGDRIGATFAMATGEVVDAATTSAVEAVAGLLARSISGGDIVGPEWLDIPPRWLQTCCRDLVRGGEHLSVIEMNAAGRVYLAEASHWTVTGPVDEDGWQFLTTLYGPTAQTTRTIARDGVFFVQWARSGALPERGQSAASLAPLAAKLAAAIEQSLGYEAGGPVTNILTIPEGTDGDDEILQGYRTGIANAKGAPKLVETTSGGYGDKSAAPRRDWQPQRLGPAPPEATVRLYEMAFDHMVAACGASPALFDGRADGTAQREALRRWHLTTVLPVAKLIGYELTRAAGAPVRIEIDGYGLDLVSRAQTVDKLTKAGVSLDTAMLFAGIEDT